jgi:hypothetical protein
MNQLISAAKKLSVRSALNPMLWLSAIAMSGCFAAAVVFRADPAILHFLIGAGCVPAAIACLGFVYFALFRPDSLRSEDYLIQQSTLQLVQSKAGPLTVDVVKIEALANPGARQLEEGEGDERV